MGTEEIKIDNNEKKDNGLDESFENQEIISENIEEEEKNEKEKKGGKKGNKKNELKEKLLNEKKEKVIEKYIKSLNELDKYKKDLEIKNAEVNDYFDKYKRSLAEMENLRKRTIQEKQDSLKYANFNIISDLLVVLDDFQRAIDSSRTDENTDLKHFVDGIEMIEKQFVDLLFKKYGVERYGEIGDEFDPKIHSAMMMEQGEYEKEEIVEIFRNGYSLHDRVIRPAEVKVGKPND